MKQQNLVSDQEFKKLVESSMHPSSFWWEEVCAENDAFCPSANFPTWSKFQEYTGGFRPREFSILCGSTGTGKTQFLANISAELLTTNTKHFVASVETGATDFVRRVVSVLLNEDINDGEKIDKKRLDDIGERARMFTYANTLYLSTIDNRMPIEFLIESLIYASQELGCKVALLDNLNFFLEVTRSSDQVIEMDRAIHELIILCKKIDMHVVMVMHPKKTDNSRVESEFDIKGSSTAVQEAHNVFLFNRPKETDLETKGYMPWYREVKIAKLRKKGRYVGKTIMFSGKTPAYTEVEENTPIAYYGNKRDRQV
jgi:replicative DNA helicase